METLENVTVLNNLKEQHATVEKQINDGQGQLEQLRATYLRLSGAIDVLEQIEGSNDPTPEVESGPETVIDEEEESE
jgi:prefoldin subunit 5